MPQISPAPGPIRPAKFGTVLRIRTRCTRNSVLEKNAKADSLERFLGQMKEPLVVNAYRPYLKRKHFGLFGLEKIHHSQNPRPFSAEPFLGITVGNELQVHVFPEALIIGVICQYESGFEKIAK